MKNLHLTNETIENIFKAVCTGNTNYIEEWFNKFPCLTALFIRIEINYIILNRYNRAEKKIKKFDKITKNRHKDFFDVRSNNDDADYCLNCIGEEKYKIEEKITNETVTSDDLELYYFLQKLCAFYQYNIIEKITKELNYYLKDE